MNKILIDTNIYSLALKGDQKIITILQYAEEIGITSISIGELLSGFKGGNREDENRHELNEFLDVPRVQIHPIDENTSEFYANTLNNLRKAGTPIPTNDIWIASVAFQHGLKLFTMDQHFRQVPGLILHD